MLVDIVFYLAMYNDHGIIMLVKMTLKAVINPDSRMLGQLGRQLV